jgi:hypothetical protein
VTVSKTAVCEAGNQRTDAHESQMWPICRRIVVIPGPACAFEQKVTVLRVMVTQTLFASCDAACTPVKVKMHRGLILG